MVLQMHRVPGTPSTHARRSIMRTGLRLFAVAGMALLAACQTGATPSDQAAPAVSATSPATVSAEPTVTSPAEPVAASPAGPTAEPAPEVGVAVDGPNTISAPAQGTVLAGPSVTVTGEGTAFEATLRYQVLGTGTGEVVTEGFTTAGANGEIGPYSFTVALEPGDWTIQVWEPGMADGEGDLGPYLHLVEVDVTVA